MGPNVRQEGDGDVHGAYVPLDVAEQDELGVAVKPSRWWFNKAARLRYAGHAEANQLKVALSWAQIASLLAFAFRRSDRASPARWWLCALLLLAVAREVVGYFVMAVTSGFNSSIVGRDTRAFESDMLMTAWVFSCLALLLALKDVATEMTALHARRSLVTSIHSMYFRGVIPYKLLYGDVDRRVDNPDQRVTNDVDMLCTSMAKLISDTFTAPFAMVYYTWYLWHQLGWTGPAACAMFLIVGVACNSFAARHLVSLVYRQEKLEGDFRYGHASFRSHIEPILLYGGQTVERSRLDRSFERAVANRRTIIARHFPLYMSIHFFDYIGSAVSYAAVGISILWRSYADDATNAELAGLISQGVWAAMAIIGNMSRMLDSAEALTDLGGYASRVSQLLRAIDDGHEGEEGGGVEKEKIAEKQQMCERGWFGMQGRGVSGNGGGCGGGGSIHAYGSGLVVVRAEKVQPHIAGHNSAVTGAYPPSAYASMPNGVGALLLEVEGVWLRVPDGRWLMEDVSFQVRRGCNLLIRGPSGAGKSSLIKAIAGLWPHNSRGTVHIHTPAVMFVPQDTYCFCGTLREQVTYPESPDNTDTTSKQRVSECLREVGLGYLGAGKGMEWEDDWGARLSRGEAQRVAIARVLFHRPELVFLDEATNALDALAEARVFASLCSTGITYVSTGHRDTLVQLHDQLYELRGNRPVEGSNGIM